jgi:hypothetical protein
LPDLIESGDFAASSASLEPGDARFIAAARTALPDALDEIEFLQGRIAFLEQLMNSAVDTVVRVKTLPVQVYDHGRMAPGDKYVEWSTVREALGNDDPGEGK